MSTWPHTPSTLTEHQKQAYGYLLYCAMLDIWNLCQSRGKESKNPLEVWSQYRRSRIAGALADWLHNLAYYVSKNFEGFDADWFWQEYEGLSSRLKLARITDYRRLYNDELKKLEAG